MRIAQIAPLTEAVPPVPIPHPHPITIRTTQIQSQTVILNFNGLSCAGLVATLVQRAVSPHRG